MTIEEQLILDLSKDNARLQVELNQLREIISCAQIKMSKLGIPSYFEDGNSSDDLSFSERFAILCDRFQTK